MKRTSLFLPVLLFCVMLGAAFAQGTQWTVQVDSMTVQEAAQTKVSQLTAQGLSAYMLKSTVPGQGIRFRVRIGHFPSRSAAQAYGSKLKSQGVISDYFVALYEGGVPPAAKPVKAEPVEPKSEKASNPPSSQRQRSVPDKSPAMTQAPPKQAPTSLPPVTTAPATAAPANTTSPAVEKAPEKAAPKVLPSVPGTVKPPKDKIGSVQGEGVKPATEMSGNSVASNSTSEPVVTRKPEALPVHPKETVATAALPSVARFEDKSFGYSFEYPAHWTGGALNGEDLQMQRIDSGAIFRSQGDAAFSHAVWNSLKNANSTSYDNNLIVDLVIKSIGSSAGLQGLVETSRKMVQEGDQIKTFVDLKTTFRQAGTRTPLEFQGKAVIIRSNAGILLVVAFYSRESAAMLSAVSDRIIGSAKVP